MPNPALNNAYCHVAVAKGCHLATEPSPDPFEKIEVVLHPSDQVRSLIKNGDLCHAQVIAAFALLDTIHGTGG